MLFGVIAMEKLLMGVRMLLIKILTAKVTIFVKVFIAVFLAVMQTAQAAESGIHIITKAASMTQAECNELMHDDAEEYLACVDALGQEVKGKTDAAQYQRLGIAYFGWVGAVYWGRVGLPGADAAARRYFLRFRPLQKQLKLSDEALCPAVAGDCKLRLAQLAAALGEYGEPKAEKLGKKG